MNRKKILLVLVCLGTLILAGCARLMIEVPMSQLEKIAESDPEIKQRKTKGPVVKILKTGFDQEEITLEKGQYVTFINYDNKPHKIFGTFSEEFAEKGQVLIPYFYHYEPGGIKLISFVWYKELPKIVEVWDELFPDERLKITIIE